MFGRLFWSAAAVLWLCGLPLRAAEGEELRSGAAIYTELCARCHGAKGEGVAGKHDEPLYGNRSLESLARLIERTMPEEDPEKCVGEEAERVAEYIFEAFYSPEARARMNPPRIDLARLTAPQYLNSVADLVASFRGGPGEIGEERGLRARYFSSRNFKGDSKELERVDAVINFDFADGTPHEKIGKEEFSIRWEGSLIAEETGEYEFSLKTQNGARLYVNSADRKPLIDAWVSSGNEPREERATIRLIGGRAYPLRVDFFQFKEKTASIALQWKPPHKAWEVIPERNLSPEDARPVLVVSTSFPPDDSSSGYERGIAVSKQWDRAVTYAAIEAAGWIVEELERISRVKEDAEDREEKLRKFCEEFAERAFRRPLSEEEKRLFVEEQFKSAGDAEAAVKRMVMLVLKSPRFLYPELLAGEPDDYDIASRLSYALWDTMPDRRLLEAASKGQLRRPAQVAAQVERMLKDPRAKAKMKGFFEHWLHLDAAEDIDRDPEAYPDFTETILSDLRTSLDRFIEEVVWNGNGDYRELILADYLYLNEPLAKFYGVEERFPGKADCEEECRPEGGEKVEVAAVEEKAAEAESTGEEDGDGDGEAEKAEAAPVKVHVTAALPQADRFEKMQMDPKERTGVLTHPYLLTAFSYYKSSSPIHRGVFLSRNIVGRSLEPPPQAIQFMDGRFDPKMTMREKVTELTSSSTCMACHSVINPLGFSLEHFDAVGRWREMEKGKPVDPVSDYTTPEGETIRLTGARDVAEHAVTNEAAHRTFVRQMFQHLIKQPPAAYGPETVEQLRRSFAANDFNVRKLAAEIAEMSALHGVEPRGLASAGSAEKERE